MSAGSPRKEAGFQPQRAAASLRFAGKWRDGPAGIKKNAGGDFFVFCIFVALYF
ncbi:MAG: hypothetical protein HUU21_07885 [Polyangiaceae bacterium]|nr:hypothetical protein [Polyangiaceae bacterium]